MTSRQFLSSSTGSTLQPTSLSPPSTPIFGCFKCDETDIIVLDFCERCGQYACSTHRSSCSSGHILCLKCMKTCMVSPKPNCPTCSIQLNVIRPDMEQLLMKAKANLLARS